ncbi:receptor-transporting protein 3 [Trachinotus anak]|uniref:receptor-transporting protein 3 n=1 Tax=Trachinotus anak TaxID=443729 RepID=UPI0039F1D9FB
MAQPEWTRIFQTEAENLLHGDSWDLQFDSAITADHPEQGWQQYIRNTSARFECTNCPRGWPSNRVMVVFHMCLMDGKGIVKVRRFRQKCKNCIAAPMVDPSIASENITILMRNLVKKIRIKCYNEKLDQGHYNHQKIDVKSPHEPDHCEGCMSGVCTRD